MCCYSVSKGLAVDVRAIERRGRLRDDVARVTQVLAGELEVLISAEPEQWHLLQPNWPSDRAPESAPGAEVAA